MKDRSWRKAALRRQPSANSGKVRAIRFVICLSAMRRSHTQDGSVVEATYAAGDTRHFAYGTGEYKIHDLENVGDTDLWFTTVEFLDSANEPLEINAITDPR